MAKSAELPLWTSEHKIEALQIQNRILAARITRLEAEAKEKQSLLDVKQLAAKIVAELKLDGEKHLLDFNNLSVVDK